MIRIKFEVEEEETPLPIESKNDRIKRILSLKFFGNNLNNSTSDNINNGNNNNVCGILKQKLLPELNGVVPKKVVPKIKKQLDNSTTDSVVAVGSKSIKTEPVESSLSLTTQLNNSLNIQSLLRQNRIQNGWTTNERSIPIGTQQQQQQSLFSTKIEPIVLGIHQEVPLFLDKSSSLILNSNSEESVNYDTAEIPSLVQTASIPIPNGTQQQQQQSFFSTKIEQIFPGIHQEVPLFLDQSSSLILNSNSGETTTTATNCDTITEMFPGHRTGFGRRAKLNVCYTMSKDPEHFSTTTTTIQMNSVDAGNLESTSNNDNNYSDSGSGSIFGVDLTSESSSSTGPSLPLQEAAAVPPLLVGKKPLPLGIPPLISVEERKARKREASRLWYQRKKTSLKLMDSDARTEIQRKKREYNQKCRQRLLDRATPEQREQIRLKQLERGRRHLEKESEKQRQQRLERVKHYYNKVGKRKRQLKRQTMAPEEREKKRATKREV